jgi:AbrB family looped-hinge helix DNA binding protein
MQAEEVVKVSAKGQIVIPRDVRRRLGITPGKKLLVAVGKEEIVLRKVEDFPLEEVSKRVSGVAKKEKLDVDALVDEAIRWARRSK